jgi:hypothetical protein
MYVKVINEAGYEEARQKVSTRFWSKVAIGGPDECWEWQAGKSGGYGMMWVENQNIHTHRIAYWLTFGCLPEEGMVRHTCDNPPCCNPKHLCGGTHQHNMNDMVTRNRAARGSKQGASKLTEEDVVKIRDLYFKGLFTQAQLATLFGVDQTNISLIVTRKGWTHVC